ncbi:MAG: N-6 DNA methylase [Bacteroidetes bacterium]|nr:N-6 DNA methylase [Bacteroidota bacterium]
MGKSNSPVAQIAPLSSSIKSEVDVEHAVRKVLVGLGYKVLARSTGVALIDKSFPSLKGKKKQASTASGIPDLFLVLPGHSLPICLWENKARNESALTALSEAKLYIEGLFKRLGQTTPGLPRIAAGFNGHELLLSYYGGLNADGWVDLVAEGGILKDRLPTAAFIANGISSKGVVTAVNGTASVRDLRKALASLKTRYRVIPYLASGRTPVDFTVALLTLRMLVERYPDWGTWAEQYLLQSAPSKEQRIFERLTTLAKRVLKEDELKAKYGDIFKFKEQEDDGEVSFDFVAGLNRIDLDSDNFTALFETIDAIPPLLNADFDIFGEVYQHIGDDSTKKALGEFFTGRHIISGVLPIVFHRAGYSNSPARLKKARIADIACGTGGFLTESLRLSRSLLGPMKREQVESFAMKAFFGFDLGHANASRARVNMYFAGDGFSKIEGGVDSLSPRFLTNHLPHGGFDVVLTNPPYGKSKYGRGEEAFLERFLATIKRGSGWGLIVLPTGVLENPRSAKARFNLLEQAEVTDVIGLPKHAFAPYTQQRTAVVLCRRRDKSLGVPANDWKALLSKIGNEEVSMYVVDNDGYANSDKRYPTDRRDNQGCWLHNELAPWLDQSGIRHDSILSNALIRKVDPPHAADEFGNPTGRKYGRFKLSDILDDEENRLLPDAFIRREVSEQNEASFLKNGAIILERLKNDPEALPRSMKSILKDLITTPTNSSGKSKPYSLRDLFDYDKGDQGFTEEVIYNNYDPRGLWVFGGGAEPPKFRVKRDTLTKHGKPITLFSGPALVISMDGSSGATRIVDSGEFCLNHHGCALVPKSQETNLHWIALQCEKKLRALAANEGGSSTLGKDRILDFVVNVPIDQERVKAVGSLRKQLMDIYVRLYE